MRKFIWSQVEEKFKKANLLQCRGSYVVFSPQKEIPVRFIVYWFNEQISKRSVSISIFSRNWISWGTKCRTFRALRTLSSIIRRNGHSELVQDSWRWGGGAYNVGKGDLSAGLTQWLGLSIMKSQIRVIVRKSQEVILIFRSKSTLIFWFLQYCLL